MKNALWMFVVACSLLLSCDSPKDTGTVVVMETTMGTIELMLYDETPNHRDNFISLVEQSFYDSLLFHRVIPDFMIQGGDINSKYAPPGVMLGDGDLDYRLNAEIKPSLFHKRGAVAAAREGDDINPAKMSSATQFYIVYGETYTLNKLQRLVQKTEYRTGYRMTFTDEQLNTYLKEGGAPYLDGQYTVFGEVTSGLDVVERIQNVERDSLNRPINDVRILKARIKN